jgi:predicted TIM-barrel fold metal-dependent hydrolase
MNATLDTVAPPAVSPPRRAPPPGTCDCHAHVFGPYDRFPFAGPLAYPPPLAAYGSYAAMLATLGAGRGVLTQPAPYGSDAAALCDALRQGRGRLRGCGIAAETIDDATLEAWHAAGIRALRFVEMRAPAGGGRYPGSIGTEALRALAPRLRALGWHAQLWASAAQLAELLPGLVGLGLPLVLDHMGQPEPAAGVDGADFQRLLAHLRDGTVWIKLTLCRVAQQPDTLRPLHDALIAANPERLLWGSDWPYVRLSAPPDAGRMLDRFMDWTGDAALIRRILVENPAALFRFTG